MCPALQNDIMHSGSSKRILAWFHRLGFVPFTGSGVTAEIHGGGGCTVNLRLYGDLPNFHTCLYLVGWRIYTPPSLHIRINQVFLHVSFTFLSIKTKIFLCPYLYSHKWKYVPVKTDTVAIPMWGQAPRVDGSNMIYYHCSRHSLTWSWNHLIGMVNVYLYTVCNMG